MDGQVFGAQATGVKRACVIGAGSMGGGIAAQFANAGIPVDLLDIPDAEGGSGPAEGGLARQIKVGGFMSAEAARLVRTGNTDAHLDRVAEADWIVEAIIEDLGAKRDLYARLDALRKPGSTVSSNTSTLKRADLVAGLSDAFGRDFVISHFFNPPRHMQLLEIVAGPESDPESVARAHRAGRAILGKTTVDCRDTPGFIANRIGCYWMAMAVLEAEAQGLTVEEADAVIASFGVPATGVFGLLDLIGIDLIPLVWGSLIRSLPASDGFRAYDLAGSPLAQDMVAKGRLGRKAGGGFYRRTAEGAREALDLASRDYRPEARPERVRDLKALIEGGGKLGNYAWTVLARLVTYTAEVADEIAHDLPSIDTAVALGYGWREGPFAQADRIGADYIAARLEREGGPVPALVAEAAARGRFIGTTAAKPALPVIADNGAARLEDAGDGIGIFRILTKMGVFSPEVFDVLDHATELAGGRLKALVLAPGSARAFSAGADLASFLTLAEDPQRLEAFLARGQSAFAALRQSPMPVVAAVHGLAYGGGCEITLHADHVVAHAEARFGLPEPKLGILPGWGGCTRMFERLSNPDTGAVGPAAVAGRTVELLLPGPTATSAAEAQGLHLIRPTDDIVMHLDDVEPVAMERARAMIEGYVAPPEAFLSVPGPAGMAGALAATRAHHAAGRLDDVALAVATDLATVLTGGPEGDPARPLPEAEMRDLERAAVLRMAARETTRQTMLATLKR
ncbi:3-hydroxyacyl-CoA dehydrogenase/enoyl-CoA hydratase family protein [Maritimibacter sp. DP1N21-5]|uniref:3-hydroxyacyl-CoA dehydrogenase/enoyl-CoA hydratase family protein n=1 Tax=Maritimibacter sp. DP1N21-5 TaxID=2836867 RepID=UPI001C47FEDA|nr:3-hydroxyacyl-CoA dehydrogenase/enoyl-CoA hydratase family protein [Maritimibacter sp. DP1N21-5]MBV7407445.1 3-hydroxyacyl-CoA dehydrogenase/enoyl-CoA hydratase family protein [Maritimibacter sp. DP1N21-5]